MKKFVKTVSYVFESLKKNEISKMVSLFNTKYVFIEIINIVPDSNFFKELTNNKSQYEYYIESRSENYMDIFIKKFQRENILSIISDLNLCRPEILSFYFTDLPYEVFIEAKNRTYNDKLIANRVAECIFEIFYDENTLSLVYNSESFPVATLELKYLIT